MNRIIRKIKNDFIIVGVDGGGTKTESLISNNKRKILGRGISGPSNPRNQGIEISVANIDESIKKAVGRRREKILAVFIGLAAVEEEYKNRIGKMSRLLRKGILSGVPRRNIFFGSDQESAFRSGTDELDGIIVITGTGCAVRGWKGKIEAKVSGWGYLADEGSAFWIGQQAYQVITKELDGRGEKSLITKLLKINKIEDINKKIYGNPLKTIPLLSIMVDRAGEKRDRIALKILKEGAEELAVGAKVIINKLKFKKNFPLVMSGGMFKSKAFKDFFKIEIKKYTSFAKFIVPDEIPAFGSLKLAIEKINERKIKKDR